MRESTMLSNDDDEYATAEEGDDDEYATAEEGDDDEYATAEEGEDMLGELGFFLYTATDGTPWYLPRYFRAELPHVTPRGAKEQARRT